MCRTRLGMHEVKERGQQRRERLERLPGGFKWSVFLASLAVDRVRRVQVRTWRGINPLSPCWTSFRSTESTSWSPTTGETSVHPLGSWVGAPRETTHLHLGFSGRIVRAPRGGPSEFPEVFRQRDEPAREGVPLRLLRVRGQRRGELSGERREVERGRVRRRRVDLVPNRSVSPRSGSRAPPRNSPTPIAQ